MLSQQVLKIGGHYQNFEKKIDDFVEQYLVKLVPPIKDNPKLINDCKM